MQRTKQNQDAVILELRDLHSNRIDVAEKKLVVCAVSSFGQGVLEVERGRLCLETAVPWLTVLAQVFGRNPVPTEGIDHARLVVADRHIDVGTLGAILYRGRRVVDEVAA